MQTKLNSIILQLRRPLLSKEHVASLILLLFLATVEILHAQDSAHTDSGLYALPAPMGPIGRLNLSSLNMVRLPANEPVENFNLHNDQGLNVVERAIKQRPQLASEIFGRLTMLGGSSNSGANSIIESDVHPGLRQANSLPLDFNSNSNDSDSGGDLLISSSRLPNSSSSAPSSHYRGYNNQSLGSNRLMMAGPMAEMSERLSNLSVSSTDHQPSQYHHANNNQQIRLQQQQNQQQRESINERRLRAKWKQMERTFQQSMVNLADQISPMLSQIFALANSSISNTCKTTMLDLLRDIKDERTMATQMIDASAKLPAGILDGTLTELGNFNECLNINNNKMAIKGSYCTLIIRPQLLARPRLHTICQRAPGMNNITASTTNKIFKHLVQHSQEFYYVGLRLGVCVPSKCTKYDIQSILSEYLSHYELLGEVKSCQFMTKVNYDHYQISIMSTFASIILLAIIGTLCEAFSHRKSQQHDRWLIYQTPTINHRADLPLSDSIAIDNRHGTGTASGNRAQTSNVSGIGTANGIRTGDLELDVVSVSSRGQTSTSDDGSNSEVALHHNDGRVVVVDNFSSLNGHQLMSHSDHDFIIRSKDLLTYNQDGIENSKTTTGFNPWIHPPMAHSVVHVKAESKIISLKSVLLCFSVIRNTQRLTKTKVNKPNASSNSNCSSVLGSSIIKSTNGDDTDDIQVIHGLRVLTMTWIIFGHSIGLVNPEMMSNLFTLSHLSCTSLTLQALLNATLAVNTFFMISGLVTAISFARKCLPTSFELKQAPKDLPPSEKSLPPMPPQPAEPTTEAANLTEPTKITRYGRKPRQRKSSNDSQNSQKNLINPKSNGIAPSVGSQETSSDSNINQEKAKKQTSFSPLLWIVMRYFRLTPTYAAIIGFSILLPKMGSGAFWQETISSLGDNCREGWWKNLLYINNFVDTDKLCLIHSWYLSNDFQFHLIAVMLIVIFLKSKKIALLLLILLMILSSMTTAFVSIINNFPPTIVTTSPAIAERWTFIHSLYYKPWPHLPSYLIGLFVGYCIVRKNTIPLSKSKRFMGWFLSLSLATIVLNSIYPWNMGFQVDPLIGGVFSATFRTLWAACCAWIIFVSSIQSNTLSSVLSWEGFQLPSRLTYSAYLLHPLVIYYHFGSLTERLDPSIFSQFHRFMSNWIITYLLSFLVTLFIESPSLRLQQLIVASITKDSNSTKKDSINIEQWSTTASDITCKNNLQNDSREASLNGLIMGNRLNHPNTPTNIDDNNSKLTNILSHPIEKSSHNLRVKSSNRACSGKHLPEAIALDTDFQQKLSQAISRGFKMRSQQIEHGHECQQHRYN